MKKKNKIMVIEKEGVAPQVEIEMNVRSIEVKKLFRYLSSSGLGGERRL